MTLTGSTFNFGYKSHKELINNASQCTSEHQECPQ